MQKIHGVRLMFVAWSLCILNTSPAAAAVPRQVVSLDGAWQVEQGGMQDTPKTFSHTIVVPGLVDMAAPAFAEVGKESKLREAFWYRREFTVAGPVPAVAMLKIHKAFWGVKVFLNGQLLGEHLSSFTPTLLDVKPYLKGDGQKNELVIRVGANRTSLPEGVPAGWDFEKYLFTPGIFDSVELILTGSPYVVNIQAVPDLPNKAVRIVAEIQAAGSPCETSPDVQIVEAKSGRVVGDVKSPAMTLTAGEMKKIDVTIPLPKARLWTPEDPFLYAVRVTTSGDALQSRFGMRSFAADPKSGRMLLNGRPYFMRGTNVTCYRFFEDASRGDLPWRAGWVRDLHKKYKTMHWNAIRYCIGFPPDFWYDIADEEGFLIQDEFPIWLGNGNSPEHPKAEKIIPQYTEWMRERWNHPCVVIWDAQNESYSPELAKSIAAVRHLDLSNRPWENGYEGAPSLADCEESHPYLFSRWMAWGKNKGGDFHLSDLAKTSPVPALTKEQKRLQVPIIINEYDWLWLNRDGSPTCLTREVYRGNCGPNSTAEERRMFHARGVAALTEFWRAHRKAAAVMHFCELGYSRPSDKPRPEGGATCDDFLDIANLTIEPAFEKYVGDSFNPVGVMIDAWDETYQPGRRDFPVIVINDLYDAWRGDVRFRVLRDGNPVAETTQPCEIDPLGDKKLTFAVDIPTAPGSYQLEAALIHAGDKPVVSLRDFSVPAGK